MITPPNKKISIHYAHTIDIWKRYNISIDIEFSFMITMHIHNKPMKPTSILEAQSTSDWPKWKVAIDSKLDSLIHHRVFGSFVPIPLDIKPIGYK